MLDTSYSNIKKTLQEKLSHSVKGMVWLSEAPDTLPRHCAIYAKAGCLFLRFAALGQCRSNVWALRRASRTKSGGKAKRTSKAAPHLCQSYSFASRRSVLIILVMVQGFDGVHHGRFIGRIQTRTQSDQRGHGHR